MESTPGVNTHAPLIEATNKFYEPAGSNSLRGRAVAAITHSSTSLRRCSLVAAAASVCIGMVAPTLDRLAWLHFGKFGQAGNTLFLAGGIIATGYSANRLWEVGSTRDRVQGLKKEVSKLKDDSQCVEVKICKGILETKLNEAHSALTKVRSYYLATTFIAAAFLVGRGAHVYSTLFRHAHKAHLVMHTSAYVSTLTFVTLALGRTLGLFGLSDKGRKETVDMLRGNNPASQIQHCSHGAPDEPKPMPPNYPPPPSSPVNPEADLYADASAPAEQNEPPPRYPYLHPTAPQ